MEGTEERRDPTGRAWPLRQPLLQVDGAQAPLRACLLSGGASRRMGCDKALLPHPEGGSWLERTLRLLLALESPVTLFSRHQSHLQLARTLAPQPGDCSPRLTAIAEPEPWEGPLLALHRLMERYPDERLLLCPVDMPWLTPEVLRSLLLTAEEQPQRIHLAHDGRRLQPLLGIYPSTAAIRAGLTEAVQGGERRLQGWLATQPIQAIRLDPLAIRNVNHPQEAPSPTSTGGEGLPST